MFSSCLRMSKISSNICSLGELETRNYSDLIRCMVACRCGGPMIGMSNVYLVSSPVYAENKVSLDDR